MGDWLSELKAGDEVAVFEGFGRQHPRIAKVDRTTATLILVGHSRFRRKDGYSPGDAWNRAIIREPSPEYRESWEARCLRERIKKAAESSETSLAILRAMAASIVHEEPQP